MSTEDIEYSGARGESMPKNLKPPQVMLWQALAALYARYQLGKIKREDATEQKRQIISAYEKYNAEYEGYIRLCKELQDTIRNGYRIGNKEVIPSEKN